MTVLLDQAIRDLAANYHIIYQFEEEQVLEKVDQETWEEVCEYRKFLDDLEYQRCLDELNSIMNANSHPNNNVKENDNRE